MEHEFTYVVGSTEPVTMADGKGICVTCNGDVYVTWGSLKRAEREGLKLLCTKCWSDSAKYTMHGVMYHGKLLEISDEALEKLIASQTSFYDRRG